MKERGVIQGVLQCDEVIAKCKTVVEDADNLCQR